MGKNNDGTVKIKRGDIIAVDRKPIGFKMYQHFAVYIGNYQVIHYDVDENAGGIYKKATIHRASFDEFIKDSDSFYVLEFDSLDEHSVTQRQGKMPISNHQSIVSGVVMDDPFRKKIDLLSVLNIINEVVKESKSEEFHLYSGSETVKRAESRLGEDEYNLLFSNCEHFAIWCKTGLHESKQIDQILQVMGLWRTIPRI